MITIDWETYVTSRAAIRKALAQTPATSSEHAHYTAAYAQLRKAAAASLEFDNEDLPALVARQAS